LRRQFYDRLQSLSYSFHDNAQTGQLMSRATADIDGVRQFVGFAVIRGVYFLVLMIAVTVLMVSLNWKLALISLAVALGISEKVVGLNFETRQRPPETTDDGVIGRLEQQVTSGLKWLENRLSGGSGTWLCPGSLPKTDMTQADVTAVCTLTHLIKRRPELFPDGAYPALASLQARAEALPVFQAAPFMEE